jgi:hypothetical protein
MGIIIFKYLLKRGTGLDDRGFLVDVFTQICMIHNEHLILLAALTEAQKGTHMLTLSIRVLTRRQDDRI